MLQTATWRIGPLVLCARCYSTYYLPLVAPADTSPERVHGMPLIELEEADQIGI
jgi:hypothetical protein